MLVNVAPLRHPEEGFSCPAAGLGEKPSRLNHPASSRYLGACTRPRHDLRPNWPLVPEARFKPENRSKSLITEKNDKCRRDASIVSVAPANKSWSHRTTESRASMRLFQPYELNADWRADVSGGSCGTEPTGGGVDKKKNNSV